MYDEQYWRANGPKIKARLTRAEKLIDPSEARYNPGRAYSEAVLVLDLMARRGYPDWWARAERLAHEAEFNLSHGRQLTY